MRISLVFILALLSIFHCHGQEDDFDLFQVITLDSFVVTASKEGFSVEDFVKLVEEDETFYEAFRNLRFTTYHSSNDIRAFNKKAKEKAYYTSSTQQISEQNCRTMKIVTEDFGGNFFKRKRKYKYYTAKLYDRIFFTKGRICESWKEEDVEPKSKMDKHIAELKKLIFSPGKKVNVPIIGDRTAIFSKKMSKYYDYTVSSKLYNKEIECYVFSVSVKPEYLDNKRSKTVIKYLETYFDKSNFQIIARQYHLEYQGVLFDFDVKMEIELTQEKGIYLPKTIKYNGFWDIPARKPEICTFMVKFFEFEK